MGTSTTRRHRSSFRDYADFILSFSTSALVTHHPFVLAHSATYACNSCCKTCSAWRMSSYAYKDLTTDQVFDLLTQAHRAGMRGYYLFGGEPLVRRDIAGIISYAKEMGFVTMLNTNGSLLAQKAPSFADKLDFAFVSLDYPNEYHDYIRGRRGNFREVTEGVRSLLENGGAKVTLVSTISKLNLDQIEGLARFAQEHGLGVSYNAVETSWIAEYNEREASVVRDYGLSESELQYFYNKLLDLKHRGFPLMESEWVLRDYAMGKRWVCHFPEMFVYVSPDGFVFPCTESFGHPLVDLRKTSFQEYFESGLYRRYVKKAEGCNECLRTCVRMYTYTYSANPLHLVTMTTAGRVWGSQIVGHRAGTGGVPTASADEGIREAEPPLPRPEIGTVPSGT